MKTSDIQSINNKKIKNIIFDWGGVITNINYQSTISAFAKLGLMNFEEYFTHTNQKEIFKQFEVGEIQPEEFRSKMRNLMHEKITDSQIDTAWCAMLRDTPIERLTLLKSLRSCYKLFILSNTNRIHAEYYLEYLKSEALVNFHQIFEKLYLSHEIRMRKPNKEIYEFVLSDSRLNPEETLFLDDTEVNIDMADSTGIQSLYLKPGMDIVNIFKNWIC